MTEPAPPKGYQGAKRRARELLTSEERMISLTKSAVKKLQTTESAPGKFQSIRAELGLMVDLVRAYVVGEYRDVGAGALLGLVAALIYFVNPLDLIPDFIFGFGLLDDAAVIGYVVNLLRGEIDAFGQWQKAAAGSQQQELDDAENR